MELLRSRATKRADQIIYRFLVNGEEAPRDTTYGQLDRRARAIAAELQRSGAAGERALLLYPAGPDFIAGFFGCLYAGAIAVPAYPPRPRRPDPRIGQILADCDAKFALAPAQVVDGIQSRIADDASVGKVRWVATDAVSPTSAEEWSDPFSRPQDLAVLQYTSGSTSVPKGVMVSHANVLSNSVALDQAMDHDADSIVLNWLPHFHDMGLIYGLLHPIYKGCMSIQMSPASFVQRPVRWLRAISYFRATHSGGPNFAYDLCVRGIPEEMRPSLDLSSWRVAFNGAEPVRKKTLDRFGECFEPCGFSPVAFRPCYGLAEATLKVTFRKLDEENTFFPASAADLEHGKVVRADSIEETGRILVGCGSTAHDTRISIVDPETLLPCESDELGEIWVSGSSVTGGYWNRPDATQAAFGAYTSGGGEGPYLRTGDLGFQADGQLFVTGRIKDLIVIRGLNHYPQDIELTVEGCDPTLRPNLGAAFSVEHQNEERLVIVHEVHRSSNKADLEPILSRIRTLVTEEHEVEPLAVVLVRHGSIAKTSSGKIQRFACRRSFLENELLVVAEWRAPSPREGGEPPPGRTATGRGDDASPPSGDDIRRWLVANISAETKLDPAAIDLNRPFAHFGLDSMRGLELVGKLEVWLGRRLPVTMLWNFPTIEALADRLSQQSEAD